MQAAPLSMATVCEEAAPLRRSRSVGLRGRYGDSEECLAGSVPSASFRIVERNTFWELDVDIDDDESVVGEDRSDSGFEKDECRSEPSSDATTEVPSTLWSEQASEGNETDHEDEPNSPIAACPQVDLGVGHVAMFYYVPTVMVASPEAQVFNMNCSAAQPKKHSPSAWSVQQKRSTSQSDIRTTIMIQNVPAECTNTMLVEMLDSAGLSGKYDLVYAPTDFRTYTAFGYAFVNLTSHKNAVLAMDTLNGLVCPTWSKQKVAFEVCWCESHQGLKVHVKRYQNSPVMHPNVLDEYKPLIFNKGVRQPFPPPTKNIKEPRLRRSNPTDAQ